MPHLLFVQVRNPSSEKAKLLSHRSQNSLFPIVLYKHSKGIFSFATIILAVTQAAFGLDQYLFAFNFVKLLKDA